jgi:hypothetical protein
MQMNDQSMRMFRDLLAWIGGGMTAEKKHDDGNNSSAPSEGLSHPSPTKFIR